LLKVRCNRKPAEKPLGLKPEVLPPQCKQGLIGGPGLLRMGQGSVRLMTAHEHWLHCPNHLLWKNDEKSCDSRTCLSCVLKAHRPPQYWRHTGLVSRSLDCLDRLIFPSHDALNRHRSVVSNVPRTVLPYFLPDDWSGGVEHAPRAVSERPYLAAAGRLVRMKGFQKLIPLMARFPRIDLKIAELRDARRRVTATLKACDKGTCVFGDGSD